MGGGIIIFLVIVGVALIGGLVVLASRATRSKGAGTAGVGERAEMGTTGIQDQAEAGPRHPTVADPGSGERVDPR
jgi:hypothetical protein